MNYTRIACISLAVTVILGSMGAHAMKPQLSPEEFNSWDTAVKYQIYHSLGLLMLSIAGNMGIVRQSIHQWSMHLIALGILGFCLSLYLRSSSVLTGMDFSWLGPVAPIGGLLFIAGWVLAAFSFSRVKDKVLN
jgi:uncharacterized membrane protein YgdD (TMEM256/DUF423 family)